MEGVDCKGRNWKRRNVSRNMADISNKEFSNLTAIFPVAIQRNNATRVAYWLCKCVCGNEVVVNAHDLKRGKIESCGCLYEASGWKRSSAKFLGKKFGLLTVIEKVGTNDNRATLWKCRCDCGNEAIVLGLTLTRGATASCGCLRRSLGEHNIARVLADNMIDFKSEYSFPDLISPFSHHPLRYDFAVFERGSAVRLIEFDGEQHDRPNEFFGGEEQFERLTVSDELKNKYAVEHRIPLVRIPYAYKDMITIDMLMGEQFVISIPPTTTERERL